MDQQPPNEPRHRDPHIAKDLTASPFASDDGSADPALIAALAAQDGSLLRHGEALAQVQASRLLVPVVAVLGEVEYDDQGLAHDKSSDMAAVLITGADGRQALLAFTSIDSMAAWNRDARPVPVSAQDAARAALSEQAAALVIDIGTPGMFVLDGESLMGVAEGWTLTRAGDQLGWLRSVGDEPSG